MKSLYYFKNYIFVILGFKPLKFNLDTFKRVKNITCTVAFIENWII